MKIQRLEITNIASIERAVIDFDKGPLGESPLFLITGDTGTGKSTILNAICLVLYNKVPCLVASKDKDKDSEEIAVSNPLQLVRRGAVEAEIVLYFEGNDERRYKASWSTYRARRRLDRHLMDPRPFLCDVTETETLVAEKSGVYKVVEQIVGLTYEQFMRTTMLAQGQFAAFMRATGDEKADILKKLTHTEIFASVGQRINECARNAQTQCDILQAEINGESLLTEQEKTTINEEITSISETIDLKEPLRVSLTAQLQWLTRRDELAAAAREADEALKALLATRSSDDFVSLAATFALWQKTADVRGLIADLHQLHERQEVSQRTFKSLQQTVAPRLLGGLLSLKQSIEHDQEKLEALEKEIGRLEPFKDMFANARAIDRLADSVVADTAKIKQSGIEIDALQQALKKCQSELKDFDEKVKEKETKSEEVKSSIEKLRSEFDKGNLNDLMNQLTNLSGRLTDLISARDAAESFVKAKEVLAAAKAENETLSQETVSLEKSITDSKSRLETAQKEYDMAEARYQGQMQLSDHINEIRKKFAETDVCPLCGTHGVELHTDSVIDSTLAESLALRDAAAGKVDELRKSVSCDLATLKVKQGYLAKSGRALSEAQSSYEKAETELRKYAEIKDVDGQIETLTREQSNINERIRSLSKIHEQLEEARAKADRLQKEKDALLKQCENSKQKISKAESEIDAKSLLSDSLRKNIAETMSRLSDMIADDELKSSLSESTVKKVARTVSEKAVEFGRLNESLATLCDKIRALQMSARQCEDIINQLAEEINLSAETIPLKVENLYNELTRFSSEVNKLKGMIANTAGLIAAKQKEIEDWFAGPQSPSREQVDSLNNFSAEDIDRMQARVESLAQEIHRAQGAVQSLAQQIAEHDKKQPESLAADKEHLAEAIKEVEASLSDLKEQRASRRERLEHDRRLQAKIRDKIEELAARQRLSARWQILSREFGGKDGKRFSRIAQSYIMKILLQKSNYYLRQLTPRYLLDCDDGSLAINIVDRFQGDVCRNVSSLSGGESFIVSLSLALGLSGLNTSGFHCDTLFIDEGFGTLDKESLETVIDTLTRLYEIGGRRIGIISHVDALKERIPTQIKLRRNGPTASIIEIATL